MVDLDISILTITTLIHLVELVKDVLLVIVDDDSGYGCPSLSRLVLKLLSTSRIFDHVYLTRLVHIELASINEILDLNPDALGLVEVLLEIFIGLLELLDLLESSS